MNCQEKFCYPAQNMSNFGVTWQFIKPNFLKLNNFTKIRDNCSSSLPRSGSRTIRDGMLHKILGGFLRVFWMNFIVLNNRIYESSIIVHDPL